MEAGKGSSFVVNGGIKMPVGYRFHPTDEELVVHYLKRKALGLPLPASVIPHLDIFQTDPWTFTGDLREKRYFFFTIRNIASETSSKRQGVVGSGYWKPTGKERPILASGTTQVVGIRTTFVFSQKKHSLKSSSTKWVMHKFCLANSSLTAKTPHSSQVGKMQMPVEWFVCRVFLKKRKPKRNGAMAAKLPKCSEAEEIEACQSISFMDIRVEEQIGYGPPEPSSPSSSEITDVYPDGFDDHEQNTCITSYPSNDCMRRRQ